ncbi:MAG: hypothetical protein V2A66_10835 [Pseudomonadota bacterium]
MAVTKTVQPKVVVVPPRPGKTAGNPNAASKNAPWGKGYDKGYDVGVPKSTKK